MIIETNPCKNCDLAPSFCGIDLDMCRMNGEPLPITEKKSENEKMIDFANNQGYEAFSKERINGKTDI